MSITVQSRRQSLTPELARLNREIEVHAREYGLDFYETFFEILDFEEMNMVAALRSCLTEEMERDPRVMVLGETAPAAMVNDPPELEGEYLVMKASIPPPIVA